MAFATGVNKQVRVKKESAFNTAAGASGAQLLRRVTSTLNKRRPTFESNEIASHLQRIDVRGGMGTTPGNIRGELSPGTYKLFMAAAMRKDFAAVSSITGLSITVAGSGPTYTITRGSGSFLTDGIKIGMVVRLSAGSFAAANLNKNCFVTGVTASALTVYPVNGVALTAEGPIASATVSVPGKVTYAPMTGHTDDSFNVEHWHADVSLSELFTGIKVDTMEIGITPEGMVSVDFGLLGAGLTTDTSAYFSSPTAETTTGLLAGPNGIITAQGTKVALVTGVTFSYAGEMSADPVVGQTSPDDITEGRILVRGSMSVLFKSATERDYFLNETEVALMAVLAASPSAAGDFISMCAPRIKFTAADKDDGPKSLVQTMPFEALLNVSGGSGVQSEQTTLQIQDSAA